MPNDDIKFVLLASRQAALGRDNIHPCIKAYILKCYAQIPLPSEIKDPGVIGLVEQPRKVCELGHVITRVAGCMRGRPMVSAHDVGAAAQLGLYKLHDAGCSVWLPTR